MSPKSKPRFAWIIAAFLAIVAIFMWLERQWVVDVIQYSQFVPSSEVRIVTEKLQLTDKAKFTFYASHPVIEEKEVFNKYCERREAQSPILGCYGGRRIYIYNVIDERLEGIKEVTAAHELLHAVYERMTPKEKAELEPLLQSAYERLATDKLRTRMAYYAKTEPGEMYNELHSIIPTEFTDIGDKLTAYYKQYFMDREAIVALHTRVDNTFDELSKEADQLATELNTLARSVNSNTERYNSGVSALNQQVEGFNARARSPNGFYSQAEFLAQRSALMARSSELDALRKQITADTDRYNELLAQLEATNSETKSLNSSIDSVLSDQPKI